VPELIEVEQYRTAAEAVVGCRIREVQVDRRVLRGRTDGDALAALVDGGRVVDARRHGKVLLLDVDHGHALALRFGMTGRLLVDGDSPIERLEYGPSGARPEWVRLRLLFDRDRELTVIDPRRLGWVELDPDLTLLGPDAASVSLRELRAALDSEVAVKTRLLDQARLAGVGNLIADETLWQVGIDPVRPARSLDEEEMRRLHRGLRTTIRRLSRRGGSHTGDLQPARHRDGTCPRCGATLARRVVGTRTTYSCPREQH
jgi:formamidopyrimidine-DNA glycosylase